MNGAIYTYETLLARTVEEGECRMWKGFHASTGVPMVRHDGKWYPVRKLFTILLKGEALPGYHVARCGNTKCVEPAHIQRKSTKQHMTSIQGRPRSLAAKLTMTQKRRQRPTKITLEQAREIRMAEGYNSEIAPKYGVSAEMVRKIRRGEAWREINSPFSGLGG